MVNGYEFFQYDRATKLHFTTEKYNVFEHKGRTNGTKFSTFLARKDYNSYNSLATKFESPIEAIQFLTSNYAYKNNNPIFNVSLSNNNFIIWKKRKQSITNTFSSDIDTIILHIEKKDISYNDVICCKDGMPELFKLYLGGTITIETLHIINEIDPFLDSWKTNMMLMWKQDLLIIQKLKKFVKFDETKIKEIYTSLSLL